MEPSDRDDNGFEPRSTEASTSSVQQPSSSSTQSTDDPEDHHMCRVCRGDEGHLYYPCLCTGSIKYVHQECLTEWLKYSKKEVCELCNYKYSFQPIYRHDMPKALPLIEILKGVAISAASMVRTWLVYTMVLISWLGIVPLTAARIYHAVFYLSMQEILVLPISIFRTEQIFPDVLKGCFLLIIFICTFISLVWLREQIIHGGPYDFLNIEQDGGVHNGVEEQNPVERQEEGIAASEVPDQAEDTDENPDEEEEGVRPHVVGGPDQMTTNREAEGEPLRPQQQADHVQPRAPNEDRPAQEVPQPEDNWRDLDRLGDELTWQRLLGLDGSLVFLERVVWVISLDTLFTIVFAYAPYKLGHYILTKCGIQQSIHYFPSIAAILMGYVAVTAIIYVLHYIVGLIRLNSLYRVLGICFLVLKVFLLVLVEIGFFPIICGCWMDLCSLRLFSASLSSRAASFATSPTSSVFIHWMIGMVYVFYFASFVLLLREVLRPGVLWFMRNLNDPEFNPIQEMIELPVTRHLRRLVASTSLCFTTIFLIVYLPLGIVQKLYPSLLPYNMSLSADTPLSELSLELLILQVVLPALLEQTQARFLLKAMVLWWCVHVGGALDVDRYLLPDLPNPDQPQEGVAAPGAGGLAAEHQALLLLREPQAVQPYNRPRFFPLRVLVLLFAVAVTCCITSCMLFLIPVMVGRGIIYGLTGYSNVHELYTVGAGLYVCWMFVKLSLLSLHWFNLGVNHLKEAIVNSLNITARLFIVCIPIVFVIPMLMGTYFQLVIITPLRLSHQQTSLVFHWQDWAMGVLHMKIVCGAVMMGPEWWMRQVFDQIYQDGIRNLRARFILSQLIFPVILFLSSILAFPYLMARFYIFLTDASLVDSVLVLRYCFPSSLILLLVVSFLKWQLNKIQGLAENIRNERYLVGTRLVNYERNGVAASSTEAIVSS
ncbi:RINGv [Parelaphostrongylus tenuis]|uniref:RING-type E3 ubiquitin transferase n=1 Tax=Parelaphostrongylus tenuis TaxID=148309 RepID=A0AAD5R455_PARTN|nr:RINGv [Parelaphostrongylus tenuis]